MNALWGKALDAAESARLLAREGHNNGAANRAYYAMFHAARALLDVGTDIDVAAVRRHSAVLSLFSQHAVKTGLVPPHLNAGLNEAFEVRAIADYENDPISDDQIEEIIGLMDAFLRAVEAHLGKESRP